MLVLNKTPNLINFTYNDFADKLKQFLVKYDCPEFILFPFCYEYCYDIPKFEKMGFVFEFSVCKSECFYTVDCLI